MQSGPEQTCPQLGLREASGIRHAHLPRSRALSPSLGAGGGGGVVLRILRPGIRGNPPGCGNAGASRKNTSSETTAPWPATARRCAPPFRAADQDRSALGSASPNGPESPSTPLHPSCRKCVQCRGHGPVEGRPRNTDGPGAPLGSPQGSRTFLLPPQSSGPGVHPETAPGAGKAAGHVDQATAETADVRGRACGFRRRTSPRNPPPQTGLGHRQGQQAPFPTLRSRHLHPRPLCFRLPLPRSAVLPARGRTVPSQVTQHRRRL